MSNIYRIGPARLLVAPSISDAPENWTDTGVTVQGVAAQLSAGDIHFGKVSELSRVPLADGVWIAPAPQYITGRLADRDATKMAATIPGVTHVTSGAKDALKIPAANTAITSTAAILVPESEYGDDGVAMESSLCVWFENATITVDVIESFGPITDGDNTDMGYSIRVESLQGNCGVGYPGVSAPTLNPQGLEYSWQYSIDGALGSALLGSGEITNLATFPSEGLTMILQLNVAASSGEVSLGDATLAASKFSVGISDTNNAWVRINGTLYTQAATGGVAETVIQVAEDGTVNVWDDSTQTITNAATASIAGLTLNSAGDDVVNSYTEAETDAVVIVRGLLTPAQIRKYLR